MTAEGLIRWYYRERESFGPPGLNFVDSTGRVYDETCSKCSGKKREPRSDGVYICADHKCAARWLYEDRHIFKGEVQKSKRPSSEFRHAKWLDVGIKLHHFLHSKNSETRTSARVYVAYVMGYSVSKIAARAAPELWGFKPGAPWSTRTVYRRKEQGRIEWMTRLTRAGISFEG